MRRQLVASAVVMTGTLALCYLPAAPALADGPIVTPGQGWVDTGIYVQASAGTSKSIVQPVGGGTFDEKPAVTCTYTLDKDIVAPFAGGRAIADVSAALEGFYYYKSCSDGSVNVVWVPKAAGAAPPAAGPPVVVVVVTPAQLAAQARDLLVLTRPAVHRSPDETNDFEGDPFTWVNLSTWFWTAPADYRPITHTVSVGPVSATVVATPVGLLFDPGDGKDAVRCPGPGRPWTDADGNDAPASGCGYQYQHVTDGAVTSRLKILWRVTWTGTGGAGGTLPTMETVTAAPLRVLQVQVVNR